MTTEHSFGHWYNYICDADLLLGRLAVVWIVRWYTGSVSLDFQAVSVQTYTQQVNQASKTFAELRQNDCIVWPNNTVKPLIFKSPLLCQSHKVNNKCKNEGCEYWYTNHHQYSALAERTSNRRVTKPEVALHFVYFHTLTPTLCYCSKTELTEDLNFQCLNTLLSYLWCSRSQNWRCENKSTHKEHTNILRQQNISFTVTKSNSW